MKKVLLFVFVCCLWQIGFGQSGEWTWMGGDSNRHQQTSYLHSSGSTTWTDTAGNLWMFGMFSRDDVHSYYKNSLWKYDIVINQWIFMKGNQTYSNVPSVYGTIGVASPSNTPGARAFCVGWVDQQNDLWLFGGEGDEVKSISPYVEKYRKCNELWKYNISSNQWTFVGGDTLNSAPGNYGMKGFTASSNWPGSRWSSVGWSYLGGSFYLFGGMGYAKNATISGYLNDIWKYNPYLNEWTWVAGDSVLNVKGVYGSKGVLGFNSNPGGRNAGCIWQVSSGEVWMYGGNGMANSQNGNLNDLWRYNFGWTWIGGDSMPNVNPTYTAFSSAQPGTRINSCYWRDANDKLWLWGRGPYGADDLWKYDPIIRSWTWVKGDSTLNPWGQYGTKGVSSPYNSPPSRGSAANWVDKAGNFWMFGGIGYDTTLWGPAYLNDMWQFSTDTTLFPVHLLTFIAQLKDDNTLLNWQVANEQNFDRYQIERSSNGKDFTSIGTVKAANKKEYNFTDNNLRNEPTSNQKPETVFYRLKMIDRDGKFEYSPIRSLVISHSSFIISPNPAHDRITLTGINMQSVTITDLAGKIVKQQTLGNTDFASIAISGFAKGIYTVKVLSGDKVEAQQVVVE